MRELDVLRLCQIDPPHLALLGARFRRSERSAQFVFASPASNSLI